MAAEDLENNNNREGYSQEDNDRKIHVSRIPTSFGEESVKRLLEEQLGKDTVEEVTLIYKRPDQDDDEKNDGDDKKKERDNKKQKENENETPEHRGFGFVTFKTADLCEQATKLQSVRGGRKATSSRKHTLYLRPYAADNEETKNICFLWSQHRCPYGDECKFVHEGEGGLLVKGDSKKKQKCFAFKKTGKCKRGDECPFSHDCVPQTKQPEASNEKEAPKKKKSDAEKDCINWKTKGKCRKLKKCPYRHDEAVREAALSKKKRKQQDGDNSDPTTSKRQRKEKQPLWVRVFGMNYETREHDIREFLQHCGNIMQVQFPRFEDSGRSKGYCGVLFQSPKAVAKAVELDGQELQGRWLQIQSGKMLLDQWEDREAQQHKQQEASDE